MSESIKTIVVVKDDEKELEIEVDDDFICFTLFIDGKYICSGDWESNLKNVFERALEIW